MNTETLPPVVEKPRQAGQPADKIKDAFEKSWNVIVWNDPVNLMSYVIHVFRRVLGFNKDTATKHMLEVHHQGKSVVATETRERAEFYHQRIQSFGLSVTIERAPDA